MNPGRVAIPVTTHGHNVTDGSVVETFHGFEIAKLMMALQPHTHLEVFLFRFLGGGQETADTGRVSGHRLFSEHIFALADRLLELHRTESRRRGEDDDIGHGDGLLVGVESDKLVLFFHLHPVTVNALQGFQTVIHPVWMHIRDGHQFDWALIEGGKRLVGRAGTASTAAHQSDLQCVTAGRMSGPFDGEGTQKAATNDGGGGGFQKIATGRIDPRLFGLILFVHGHDWLKVIVRRRAPTTVFNVVSNGWNRAQAILFPRRLSNI